MLFRVAIVSSERKFRHAPHEIAQHPLQTLRQVSSIVREWVERNRIDVRHAPVSARQTEEGVSARGAISTSRLWGRMALGVIRCTPADTPQRGEGGAEGRPWFEASSLVRRSRHGADRKDAVDMLRLACLVEGWSGEWTCMWASTRHDPQGSEPRRPGTREGNRPPFFEPIGENRDRIPVGGLFPLVADSLKSKGESFFSLPRRERVFSLHRGAFATCERGAFFLYKRGAYDGPSKRAASTWPLAPPCLAVCRASRHIQGVLGRAYMLERRV